MIRSRESAMIFGFSAHARHRWILRGRAAEGMKLNCDLAEGAGCEAAVMPYLDQANIACGAHAGDTELMRSTVALARDTA